MNCCANELKNRGFIKESQLLQDFQEREALYHLDKSEFDEAISIFADYPCYHNLIPILSDRESNYWCFCFKGITKGMIYYLSHDGEPLLPVFHDMHSFIECINHNPELMYFWDFQQNEQYDFPVKADFVGREQLLSELYQAYHQEMDYDMKLQLLGEILTFCLPSDKERYITPLSKDDILVKQAIEDTLIRFKKIKSKPLKTAIL